MARRSRVQNNNSNSEMNAVKIEAPLKSIATAGYVRLSVKDLKREGDSIETQKKIILNYISNNPDLHFLDFYIDDGISGTTFERAAFIKMLEDAEKRKLGCIVVKDITRFGRDAINTADYITRYFPSKGIRFISINDEFDTARDDVNLVFKIKSLISEYYATDIGNKVRFVINHQMESGKYVGSRPPFGYIKAPDDCHQLVLDEPAANVVRQIFGWAEKGNSISEIVRLLNDANIKTPSHYWFQTGLIKNADMIGDGQWHARTVSKILSNEVYTGKLVQGKTRKADNKQLITSLNNLIEIENTHEPVIPMEMFIKVQEALGHKITRKSIGRKNLHEAYSQNLFVGKVFCAHCGSSLNRKKNCHIYIYRCTTKYSASGKCIGNSIKEDALIEAINEQIIRYTETLSEECAPDAVLIKNELEMLKAELSYKDNVLPELFESLYKGDISEDRFRELKELHNQKANQLEQRREQLTKQVEELEAAQEERRELKSALDKFNKSMKLTQYLVDKLIQRIVIYNDGRVFLEFKLGTALGPADCPNALH